MPNFLFQGNVRIFVSVQNSRCTFFVRSSHQNHLSAPLFSFSFFIQKQLNNKTWKII